MSSVGSDSYTELQILNPYGSELKFAASGNSGAIGYQLDNTIFWIKGTPEINSVSSTEKDYQWENDGKEIILHVVEKEKEIELTLKLEGSESQPSAWILNLTPDSDEYFTGAFERVVDGKQTESWAEGIATGLNLRGEKVDVKLKPTVSAYAPFYISSGNYSFFARGTWPGVIDFCKTNSDLVTISFEGPEFAFSLMMDENPAELVKRHALETGPSFVPPRWVFGPWRWRDEHVNRSKYVDGSTVDAPYNSELVEDVLMMDAYDIPMTAYWIDRPWGPGVRGFDDYLIDEERLPQFEEMIQWLNKKEIEVMLWIGPFVMGDMADEAKERGFNLESKQWKNSRQVLMDFTNEEAVKWWGENGPGKLAKMGVKGFKLDRADGEKLTDSLHLKTSIGRTYRENFNDYPRQYVKATYEAVKPILGDDFVLFPRAQYTGSAKYGAMWAGDTGNPQEGLRAAIIGMQRCAVMGYPNWGSDTGGYPKRMEREATMRWMGFSCFSPIMEVGPTNNLGFWAMDYEPSFDHELLAIWRFYSKLRMSLIDYVYNYSKIASETGMPIARPMFLEYPNQPESWNDWTTYMLGDDLLVSAVWENGQTKKLVYLPTGETWVDLWTNQEFEGGQSVEVDAPLYQIPIFLRKGSKLKLPNFNTLYQESVEMTSKEYKMSGLEAREEWTN
ncbi:TIM-barrel domain-containing protein [Sunxiuqinia indica]|uniref:TIM-barrel domain-containing protein n=1 Tax=Sunxiuqinia indica TaxID=2692584 RepID=UPI001357F098|nr:TIM-barrel domain-containing protein [Sunxiuqinia indica]